MVTRADQCAWKAMGQYRVQNGTDMCSVGEMKGLCIQCMWNTNTLKGQFTCFLINRQFIIPVSEISASVTRFKTAPSFQKQPPNYSGLPRHYCLDLRVVWQNNLPLVSYWMIFQVINQMKTGHSFAVIDQEARRSRRPATQWELSGQDCWEKLLSGPSLHYFVKPIPKWPQLHWSGGRNPKKQIS